MKKIKPLVVTNEAPSYIQDSGGAQWVLETVSGASASATRDTRTSVWTLLAPDGTFTHGSALWTNTDAIIHLKSLLRKFLTESLAQLLD